MEIPYTFSLAQISNILNDEIFKRENGLLRTYKSIHEEFSKISLEGGDSWNIVKLATKFAHNPVLMLDSNFNLLAYADLEGNPYPLKTVLTLNVRERCLPKEVTATIPRDVNQFTLNIKRQHTFQNVDIIMRFIPIAYSQIIYGFLVVWQTIRKMAAIDYIALEEAAKASAIERIKSKQMEEERNRIREDFFDDLLQGRILSVNAMKGLATINGINPEKKHLVLVTRVNPITPEVNDGIVSLIENLSFHEERPTISVTKQGHIISFVEVYDHEDAFVLSAQIRPFFEHIQEEIKRKYKEINVLMAVSNINDDFMSIGKSYRMTLDIIQLSSNLRLDKGILFFNDLMSYHLIDTALNNDSLKLFFNTMLGTLHQFDQANNTNLLETLDFYFQNNASISDTAKQMYVHRNTIIYRLDKIKQLLNTDLKVAEINFNLQLALHINRVLRP